MMKIPTTLYLTDNQIDRLVTTAAKLIRDDKDFQLLMNDLAAKKSSDHEGSIPYGLVGPLGRNNSPG
jgi:hypothetical protein